MELEQRVKTLEYEVKILKNEIQKTLLDIQEQVLIHYYPALRTEETDPSEGLVQAVRALRARQANSEETDLPAARQVTLEEIRTGQDGAAAFSSAPSAVVNPSLEQVAMARLSGWVSESAACLGKERVGRLVVACRRKGILSAQAQDVLLKVVSLARGAAPEKADVNQLLGAVLKLDELLGRAANKEEAVALIKEAGLG